MVYFQFEDVTSSLTDSGLFCVPVFFLLGRIFSIFIAVLRMIKIR